MDGEATSLVTSDIAYGNEGYILDELRASKALKTVEATLERAERLSIGSRIGGERAVWVFVQDATDEAYAGYALVRLFGYGANSFDGVAGTVFAAEVRTTYKQDNVLEVLKARCDALIWLHKAQLEMKMIG